MINELEKNCNLRFKSFHLLLFYLFKTDFCFSEQNH